MNIGIDARWIFPEISGIGAYTRELIRHLALIPSRNQFTVFFSDPAVQAREVAATGITDHPRFRCVRLPFPLFSLRNQFLLPARLRQLRLDVYHSPGFLIPIAAFPRRRPHRTRCVVTIHDVIPMVFPHAAPRSRKARIYPFYRRLMIEIGRRVDCMISDSDAASQDVIRHLAVPPENADRFRSIYCGVADRYRPAPRPAQAPVRTVLYVGRFDPYKNVATLIRAFADARTRCPSPLRLQIVGKEDPRYPEAKNLIHELGLQEHVLWTGYLSDADVVHAYQAADVLVHPSRYEGFGLPPIEAMACGTPVICSNVSALPEVVGDAALLHDPDDTRGFADSIVRVLTEPELADALRRAGLARAAEFTWERTARQTLALYEEVFRA